MVAPHRPEVGSPAGDVLTCAAVGDAATIGIFVAIVAAVIAAVLVPVVWFVVMIAAGEGDTD